MASRPVCAAPARFPRPEALAALAAAAQRPEARLRTGALSSLAHIATWANMPAMERFAACPDKLTALVCGLREHSSDAIFEVAAAVCNFTNYPMHCGTGGRVLRRSGARLQRSVAAQLAGDT